MPKLEMENLLNLEINLDGPNFSKLMQVHENE